MVSHPSIIHSIYFLLAILLGAMNNATTAYGSTFSVQSAPHNLASDLSILPSIIPSRTQPVRYPKIRSNLNTEAENILINKKWFLAHGGNLISIKKRDANTVAGMTLVVPANAPPVTAAINDNIVYATPYQIEILKFFAGIASTAHCPSVIPSGVWECPNCKTHVPVGKMVLTFKTPIHDIHGFILRSDSQKTIYLVFRGTRSNRNRIDNITFGKVDYTPVSGAHVHQEFYDDYKEASTYFFSQLQAQHNAYSSYKVIVIGHSLGGAQALLAGMDLYQRLGTLNSSNLKIYTFGCPRVGDANFAYYVESTGISVSRSVHSRDIVPHVPRAAFGFVHPGVEVWEKSNTDIEICGDFENDSCSNSIAPFTSVADHFIYYNITQFPCV